MMVWSDSRFGQRRGKWPGAGLLGPQRVWKRRQKSLQYLESNSTSTTSVTWIVDEWCIV